MDEPGLLVSASPTLARRLALGTVGVALLAAAIAHLAADRLDELLIALPVTLTVAATTAAGTAAFLGARARALDSDRLRWVASGYGIATLAMSVQLLGFPAVSTSGGPLGTTSSGAAGLYLTWHLVLPVFALLGASHLAASRPTRRAAIVGALLLTGASAWGAVPFPPPLLDEAGRYLPLLRAAMWVVLAVAVVAVVVWHRATRQTRLWTEAWIGVSLTFGAADLGLHSLSDERFTAWWWASLSMRLAEFAVPAIAISWGFVRLFNELDRHASALRDAGAEQARAHAELSEAHTGLLAANAELDAFAGMIAHDLRGPLAIARGFAETARDASQDPAVRQLLDRALAGHDRGDALIGDLLALARTRHGDLALVDTDLGELVAGAVRNLPPEDRAAEVVTVVGPLPRVRVDAGAVRQLLVNLLGNAIRYGGGGPGGVEVAATGAADGGWRVTISDRGPGVPEADRDRVFDPFVRLDATRHLRGTGLGLAIARLVVERHGGELGVEPRPGGGSTFWFTLPPAPADGHVAAGGAQVLADRGTTGTKSPAAT
ncbi:MAG: sensor histidine kinase [Actinomycetes bacterium]